MGVPNVKPFSGALPRKPFDERDPRALDLFKPWEGTKLPDYGLVGVPFDGAVTGRKGTAQGPAAIREALRFSSSYNFEEDVDLFGLNCADLGDVDVPSNDVAAAQDRTTQALRHIWENGAQPLVLGGDNSITFASVRALAQSGAKRIGILDLDAHMDVRVPNPDVTSGSPYYQILEHLPEVKPQNIVQVGLRRFANSKTYREWGIKKGMRLFPIKEIRRRGFQGLIEIAVDAALDGVDALYLSLDMDVVDQAWAPGVSSPSPDGLTPREVFDAIHLTASKKQCRGFEVVETAPNLDPTGNTARVAALGVLQYLVGRKAPPPAPKAQAAPRAQPAPAQRAPYPPRAGWGGGRPGGRGGFGSGGRGPPRGRY